MRKYTIAILVFLLMASIIANLSMLYQNDKAKPSKGEIKGAYELLLVDLRAVQSGLHSYLAETDPQKKQQQLYDVLNFTYKTDSDLKILDFNSNQLYKRGLSPLPSYTSDFIITSSRLYSSYAFDDKELVDAAKKYNAYIDDLVMSLDGTSMTDKKSSKNVFDKIESYSKSHSPVY